jgi:hypothetical protein
LESIAFNKFLSLLSIDLIFGISLVRQAEVNKSIEFESIFRLFEVFVGELL